MKRKAKRTRQSLGRLAQPVWGRIRAAEAGWNRLAKEDLERIGTGRHAPRMYKFFPALVALFVGAVAGTWLLFAALARLTGSHMSWWRPRIGSLDPGRLFDVTRSTISFAAVFGGLFAVLYAYRKQRVDEAVGHRADAESLGRRYQDAAEQMGHERAAVRLAGVYAMTRLADEWPEQRQTCIDVLCAYLRMPVVETEHGAEDAGDLEVKRAIMNVITRRVTQWLSGLDGVDSWSGYDFDFSRAVFDDLELVGLRFAGATSFRGATFRGACEIVNCHIEWRGLDLRGAAIQGSLDIATIEGREVGVALPEAVIRPGGRLRIFLNSRARYDLAGARVSGRVEIEVHPDRPAGTIIATAIDVAPDAEAIVISRGRIEPSEEPHYGPYLDLEGWLINDRAQVTIDRRLIDHMGLRWDPQTVSASAEVAFVETGSAP
jgi:hypothetical protein